MLIKTCRKGFNFHRPTYFDLAISLFRSNNITHKFYIKIKKDSSIVNRFVLGRYYDLLFFFLFKSVVTCIVINSLDENN